MIKDGFIVKEASLGFDFGGKITGTPWPPGRQLMKYIENVSMQCKLQRNRRTVN